uniref:Uncharacterized protein LOC104248518 n=1 Tax=Nicotiana sylvestris TaxID=4096 RepID=A0A1U7YG53_NICSY|nr:PREDICTED: uncharacterized protein LOC104248518 [Nicotiana sylvestris]
MNTISPSLISSVIYASDAYTVWEDLKKRFDRDNASRACYLHKEIAILTQGISYVSVHYTKLRELWDEYETLTPPPTCGCAESRKYVEHYQIQKLYQFLTGLNESYENAKNHVLMTRPLPNLNQAYAMIVNVKSQRIDEKCVFDEGNEAAMMSNKGYSGGQTNNNPNGWFIGGYNSEGQNKWKGGTPNAQANSVTSYGVSTSDIQGQGHQTPVTSPAHFFTQEQYQQIQHLLNKDKEAEPVASAVTAGTTELVEQSTQPAVDLNDVEYPAASPSQFPTTTPGQHSIDAVESPSSSLSSISIPSNLGQPILSSPSSLPLSAGAPSSPSLALRK